MCYRVFGKSRAIQVTSTTSPEHHKLSGHDTIGTSDIRSLQIQSFGGTHLYFVQKGGHIHARMIAKQNDGDIVRQIP